MNDSGLNVMDSQLISSSTRVQPRMVPPQVSDSSGHIESEGGIGDTRFI